MANPAPTIAHFPEKLQCLFIPKRFKVLFGGRAAGRSWGCARALLTLGTARPLRILCVRELQNSLAESVHKLLCDQIDALGLGGFYSIQRDKIEGRNGTTFSFDGIKNNTRKIKSYEGIDICWVEEANMVTKGSWEILIPTVRKEGSEIWMTFNPELEGDYTYERFVTNCGAPEIAPGRWEDDRTVVMRMNYRDNPWVSKALLEEIADLKLRDYDAYMNVWEGHCRQMLDGVIYAKQLREAQESGRICKVGWDRETPVDTFWDLGHSDHTCIWFAQRVAMEYRVLEYYESSQEDIHHYLKFCQERPYTYGTFYLPHDAKAKRLVSKRSIEEIIRGTGKSVSIIPKLSVADGINAARIMFPGLWFDAEKCADGLYHLRRYRYKVVDGKFSREPEHDTHSDAADAFRYMALGLRAPQRGQDKMIDKLAAAMSRFGERKGQTRGLNWMGR